MTAIRIFARALACAAALAAAPATAPLTAQAQPCTYDECALRIRAPTFTTPSMLVRGSADEKVVQLGLFQPSIAPLMTRSDSAAALARVYDVLYDRGGVISIAGTVIAIAAPIIFEGTLRKIAYTAVGVGLSVYGGTVTNRANDALSRAIWWHNRELEPPRR